MRASLLCLSLMSSTALAADSFVADPGTGGFRLVWDAHANERQVDAGDLDGIELDGREDGVVTVRWQTRSDLVFESAQVPCEVAMPELRRGLPWLVGSSNLQVTLVGEPCGAGVLRAVLADRLEAHADSWQALDDRVVLRWEEDDLFRPLHAGSVTYVHWGIGPTEFEVLGRLATRDGRHYQVHLACVDHEARVQQARMLFAEAEQVDESACSPGKEVLLTRPDPLVRVEVAGARAGLAEQLTARLEAAAEQLRGCVPEALGAIDLVVRLGRDGELRSVSPRKDTSVTEAVCLADVMRSVPPFDGRGNLKVHVETAW